MMRLIDHNIKANFWLIYLSS